MSASSSAGANPSEPEEIALFPLRAVVYPGGPLELRIFEPRYLDMIRAALKSQKEFGVLLILTGTEVGPVETAEVGTSVRIVDFSQLPDGLLGISCVGTRRFRLHSRRQQHDGLNVGIVEWLPEPAGVALPSRFEGLAQLVESLLPEFGERYQHVERRLTDAAWVGYRLTEILPLTPEDKQSSLELDDPLERLERLALATAQLAERRRSRDA